MAFTQAKHSKKGQAHGMAETTKSGRKPNTLSGPNSQGPRLTRPIPHEIARSIPHKIHAIKRAALRAAGCVHPRVDGYLPPTHQLSHLCSAGTTLTRLPRYITCHQICMRSSLAMTHRPVLSVFLPTTNYIHYLHDGSS